jgi:hypothetical protein
MQGDVMTQDNNGLHFIERQVSAEIDLIGRIIGNRLTPAERLEDVLAGSVFLANRRAALAGQNPNADHLIYILSLFTWWPFKPDLSNPAEIFLLQFRSNLFRGASNGDFNRLADIPDEILGLSAIELLARQLGEPEEYLAALGILRPSQEVLVVQLQQSFSNVDEMNDLVQAFHAELVRSAPDAPEIRTFTLPQLGDIVAPAMAALLIPAPFGSIGDAAQVILALARSWLEQRRARKITLSLGGDSVEIARANTDEQEQLIYRWQSRHGEANA